MPDLSMERLDAWLHPREFELAGIATSQQEFDYLRTHAFRVRHQFVLDAAAQAIADKSTDDLPSSDVEFFASLPARNYLTRSDHDSLRGLAATLSGRRIREIDTPGYWHELAEVQAAIDGFSLSRNKYDSYYYETEERFAEAAQLSAEVQHSGYPVRFFMRGVKYIGQAALNLDTVNDWVEGRSDFDPNLCKEQWLNGELMSHYLRASSRATLHGLIDWPFVRDQMLYWKAALATKKIGDEYVPWLQERKTYADCVEVLAPGLYRAPYLPDEVTTSGNFVDYDDVHRAALIAGQSALAATTRTFNDLVYTAGYHLAAGDDWRRISRIVDDFSSGPAMTAAPGVVFMSRGRAEEAVDYIDAHNKNRKVARTIGQALVYGDAVSETAELDQRLLS